MLQRCGLKSINIFVTSKETVNNTVFISKCLYALASFELIDRCGESIAVLDEGFKHLNQATHLAKVRTGIISLVYRSCGLK